MPHSTQPFFDGLSNVDILAGQPVEIVYLLEDPEGELPGMFPEKLPQGATFEDNFDGSKTFHWVPLQKNVGITRFTVTALDPANGLYRTSQSVLIRVSLPEDLSTIPNVAPTLDPVIPHFVRVNDPVVIELKGIDLNGSVPTIELPILPEGATLTQDLRFEEVNPEAGRYQFAATDNLIAYASLNDLEVHGHPLIWYRQVPAWIALSSLAERETHPHPLRPIALRQIVSGKAGLWRSAGSPAVVGQAALRNLFYAVRSRCNPHSLNASPLVGSKQGVPSGRWFSKR